MKPSSLLIIVVFVIAFYVLMILPQRRQQKQKQQMMQKLAPGAKVMTSAGIFARIVEIRDNIVLASIATGVTIELDSRAVVRVVESSPEESMSSAMEHEEREDVDDAEGRAEGSDSPYAHREDDELDTEAVSGQTTRSE